MKGLTGQLLISGGGLFDASFRHTVVLIGAHDSNGAVGVIINRPLKLTVNETIPALAELTRSGELLFEGGPVETNQAVLLVEMADAEQLSVPVLATVGFLTGDVPADVRPDIRRARVYLGHAGWGPGQLEAELEAGAWIVEPASADDIFTAEPLSLWRRLLERKGPPFDVLARVPFDPRTN